MGIGTREGQGALEVLLLIGGGVLVATIVILITISSTTSGNVLVENGIASYIDSTHDAAGLDGEDPSVPVCGNGTTEPPTEQCDDNNTIPNDGCSSTCQIESPVQFCGPPHALEGSEQCDGTNFGSFGDGTEQCDEYYSGGYAGGDLTCDPITCTVQSDACDPLPPPPVCGDGALNQPSEACDGSDMGSYGNGIGQCSAFASVYVDGDLSCNNNCTINYDACIIPPEIVSFTGDWYDAKNQLFFSGTGSPAGVLSYTLARGTNLTQIQNITSIDFDTPPGGIITIPVAPAALSHMDSTVTNGSTYHYTLRACDNVTSICTISPLIVSLTPHVPIISFSLGGTSIMFDYSASSSSSNPSGKCEPLDVPDTFANAIFSNGELILSANNAPTAYLRRGTNFSNLKSDCLNKALISTQSTTPSAGNNYEWLNTIYKKGNTIYGLVHNEFHDTLASSIPPCNTSLSPSNPCWWNTITLAKSTNNGLSFDPPASPSPNVSAPPFAWSVTTMKKIPYGHMTTTNIISREENGITYYYSFFIGEHGIGIQGPTTRGICLMRTSNLDDASSWRAWNGSSFSLTMNMPYSGSTPANTGQPLCSYISLNQLGVILGHVTFNTYLQEYIMIGGGAKHDADVVPAVVKCGVWYSRSKDLINWTNQKILFETSFAGDNAQCNSALPKVAYASMLDEDQINDPTDPNFERSDNTFHIYYTQFNSAAFPVGLDRDLVKRPITLTKT